jgi:hypothetical protein
VSYIDYYYGDDFDELTEDGQLVSQEIYLEPDNGEDEEDFDDLLDDELDP